MRDQAQIRVAVLGAGVVGTEVIRLLTQYPQDYAARVGAPLEVVAIAVRSERDRDPVIDPALLTLDARAAVESADLVIEVMGGLNPAGELIEAALSRGVSVVSANKALLAERGPQLYALAAEHGASLAFEAAVAGAVPVVRGLRESLAGDDVTRVLGIVNGTTNYILDEMTTRGLSFDAALSRAQELGYAEADPTADVDGLDAAAKAALVASLAFHTPVSLSDVTITGIREITGRDIEAAASTGHVVKLLAIAEQIGEAGAPAGVAVRVHPALVHTSHPLASVHGAFNAVFIEARAAGTLMFYGQGAGGQPTASAVLGDVISVARHLVTRGQEVPTASYRKLPIVGPDQIQTRYQIRAVVPDQPGELAKITGTVADHRVSLEEVRQVPEPELESGLANLILVTHLASEADLAACVDALATHATITSVLRVEGN